MPEVDLEQVGTGSMPPGLFHLAYLLRFHNAVMSGGLAFAVEVTDDNLFGAVLDASRYLGLTELATFLERVAAAGRDDDALEELGGDYMRITGEDVPGPALIDRAFEAKLMANPSDFEDIETSPGDR